MDLTKYMKDIHEILSSDEQLMRLLFYVAEDMNDDVLDTKRPDILGNTRYLDSGIKKSESVLYDEIVRSKIKLSSVSDSLDENIPSCQVNAYFEDIDVIEKDGSINAVLLKLNFTIDMYAHKDYDTIDFRLMKIVNRIYELFYYKSIIGMGKLILTYSSPINDKEEAHSGFVGYRLKFRTNITAPKF